MLAQLAHLFSYQVGGHHFEELSSLQTWAAMRGASQELRDTIAPPPMSGMLRLAAAHVSGLQGHLSVCDLGPVLLVRRHCHRQHVY